MCGRFIISKKAGEINERFHVDVDKEQYKIIYNAAPGQKLPVITNTEPSKLNFFKWGLVPFWAKDEKTGYKMINARAETLLEKLSFKKAVQKRRCLVVADGFYEWKKQGTEKQPYRIYLKDEPLFAFAGLWEHWKKNGRELFTFTIITTASNKLMKNIHKRMPVILNKNTEKIWIDEDFNLEDLKEICLPYPGDLMRIHPVSKKVNSPANNNRELIDETLDLFGS